MTTLFISDLHLSSTTPDITDCFIRFMREEAVHADALYVLGDLFEFWIGDDDRSDFAKQIRREFKQLTSLGVPCYFTQGNRDFLVGKRFAKQTGVTLLGDETVIDLYGKKAVVLHGDTLCTEDVKYLQYREKVHQPWLQWLFNRIPMFIKKKIVSKVQSDIRTDKQTKSLDIMDVTQTEVEAVMAHHNVDLMIHGHTHRPNVHVFSANNTKKTRIVLGDWYTQGSVLVYAKNSFELEARPFQTSVEEAD
ncbi:UDP-2,3-diacylglucosamine diphosphatase [Vibrio coralliilyticus]|uniref:UDP-2,3-diacylglucosamine diphosphatase n=1 Tax=Vibrio coralliilyticus TaxID=190893 RepID=UPI00155F96AA|nr:UDP-2,3-diacylglucosamine diphosphatase [Vibrio coralliilyticus]NRF24866.1 UDP-2,3-diacylglucosamine diphosphatase [Vibrio coralliilyticus]NRF78612.1 UDP-2,3-diacylglucosamine diphosphatase [Vibrio coralliilyticus]